VGSVCLLLGGILSAALPQASWLARRQEIVDLRATGVGHALVLVGLAILTVEWLLLCRRAASARGEAIADAVGLVRHATVVWCAPLVLAPPLFSLDGWAYAAQGMLWHVGISPYEHGPGILDGPVVDAMDPRWLDTPTPYGPVPVVLGALAAGETGNPWMLVIAHRAFALAGLALLAWAVPRLAAWTGVNPALASALVLASPLMLAHGVGGLHNDVLMVGLMAAALVVAVERGWVAGALVGGLAAAVKVPGGLVCIAVALLSLPPAATVVQRVRRLASVGALAAGLLLGIGLVTGLGLGWVHGLSVPATMVTPYTLTARLDSALGGTGAVHTLGTAVSAMLVVAVALRWRTGDRARAVEAVALMTGVAVLLGPVVQPWYVLWAVPFVAVVPAVSRVRARRVRRPRPAPVDPPPSPAPSNGA
jgi:alpha-1,6-mannosyltransferase